LGILHTDKKNRDSLALDLLEPLRPAVDRHVLRLLLAQRFRATDFHETRQGACRLLPRSLTTWQSSYLPTPGPSQRTQRQWRTCSRRSVPARSNGVQEATVGRSR
jgi:CRISPR/Cas system-associated endonuclease Cas1